MTKHKAPHFEPSRFPPTRTERRRNALAQQRRRDKKDPFAKKMRSAAAAWTKKNMRVPNWQKLLAKFNRKMMKPISEQCFLHRYDGSFEDQPCFAIPFGKCKKNELVTGRIVGFSCRHGFSPYRNYWVKIEVSSGKVYVQDATAVYAEPSYVSASVRQERRVEKLMAVKFGEKDLVALAEWVASDAELVPRRLQYIDDALERARSKGAVKKALGLDW